MKHINQSVDQRIATFMARKSRQFKGLDEIARQHDTEEASRVITLASMQLLRSRQILGSS